MAGVDTPRFWRRSSRCESLHCVEVGWTRGRVHVRDSTQPHGAQVVFSTTAWRQFCAAIRVGGLRG
ncbi:MAG TPA: DUF397 domain-containing protein [Pilimelia sp.]|nr:DUF397 domain-containing protein [Pilimelia sp.]